MTSNAKMTVLDFDMLRLLQDAHEHHMVVIIRKLCVKDVPFAIDGTTGIMSQPSPDAPFSRECDECVNVDALITKYNVAVMKRSHCKARLNAHINSLIREAYTEADHD